MEEELNYQLVPYNFPHCFKTQCPKGEKCLHHLVAVHSTDQYSTLSVVNPNCIPADTNSCPFFRSIQKMRVAWGVSHLLDDVAHKDAIALKSSMISHFGRGLYYRFYRKERFLNPEAQEFIRRLFRQKGLTEEPVFDTYTYEYKW